VAFQEEIWGAGFSERVPLAVLKIASRLGGVVAGSRLPDGRLAGFVFGLTGLEEGVPVHWSDMLAVRPGLRDAGLGTRLKAYQRRRLLERGVRRTYWTFDPLESKNAHLNLARLGAVAREYLPDMYGESGSPLHRGIGTDRFLAVWEMDSPRVETRLAAALGGPAEEPAGGGPATFDGVAVLPKAFEVALRRGVPAPEGSPAVPDVARFLVPIPADLQALKEADPELAVRWRAATRAVLLPALGRGAEGAGGYEARELVRDPEGHVSYYVLARGGESPS
jgi:predicted GNAT superfamily acetyltransferase